MSNNIYLLLADGFEEIEAFAPTDFLRRVGFNVFLTSVKKDKEIEGSHGIKVQADKLISEIEDAPLAIVLPGGMPGSETLKKSKGVIELIKSTYLGGNLIAAICAAPIALQEAGITKNIKITSHPSVRERLTECKYTNENVEKDSNIITAKGPGTALEFAKAIADNLGKKEAADEVSKKMCIC